MTTMALSRPWLSSSSTSLRKLSATPWAICSDRCGLLSVTVAVTITVFSSVLASILLATCCGVRSTPVLSMTRRAICSLDSSTM